MVAGKFLSVPHSKQKRVNFRFPARSRRHIPARGDKMHTHTYNDLLSGRGHSPETDSCSGGGYIYTLPRRSISATKGKVSQQDIEVSQRNESTMYPCGTPSLGALDNGVI